MAHLETVRPFEGDGRSRHFLVRAGCNDSSDLAQHQQVQLARRREKIRCNIGAKRTDAITCTSSQVLKTFLWYQMEVHAMQELPSVFSYL